MSDAMPDPQNSAAYKAAKLAVIILSGLIILALIALLVGAAMKLSGQHAPAAVASGSPTTFRLPQGASIVTMETQPGRVILRLRLRDTEEIDIVDMETGRLVSRIKVNS